MIRILSRHFINPYGTTQLRCLQPAEYLKNSGYEVEVDQVWNGIKGDEDIVILHRVAMDFYVHHLIEYAKNKGITILFDTDDLLFTSEGTRYLKNIGMKNYEEEQDGFLRVMQESDAVLVSTSTLKKEASRFHNDVRLMKNALSAGYTEKATQVLRSKKKSDNITLAYLSGSKSHDRDFNIVYDALLDILRSRTDVKLLVVGPLNYPEELSVLDNFEHREQLPYNDFISLFEEIDVNLIPLEVEEPFCQSKSELKFIEAGGCGVPSIASPTTPHLEVIHHSENGMLATADEWKDVILKLVDDAELRAKLGKKALQTVEVQYYPGVRSEDWKILIESLQKVSERVGVKNAFARGYHYVFLLILEFLYLIKLGLRNLERVVRLAIRSKFPKKT